MRSRRRGRRAPEARGEGLYRGQAGCLGSCWPRPASGPALDRSRLASSSSIQVLRLRWYRAAAELSQPAAVNRSPGTVATHLLQHTVDVAHELRVVAVDCYAYRFVGQLFWQDLGKGVLNLEAEEDVLVGRIGVDPVLLKRYHAVGACSQLQGLCLRLELEDQRLGG